MSLCFMLVAADALGISGPYVAAYDVAQHRLARRMWPLYRGTKNRRAIGPDDRVLIYVGGTRVFKQTFVASARVQAVEAAPRRAFIIDPPNALTDAPDKIIRLDDVVRLDPPISLRPLLGRLEFLPRSKNWGAIIAGGCRRMGTKDFMKILEGDANEP